MKANIRFLLILMASMIFTNAFSQTYLTKGEVYNFNVGDIIQTRGAVGTFSPSSAPIYETKTILTKTYTNDRDAIIYSIRRDIFAAQRCAECTTELHTDTIISKVTELNTAVNMDNLSSCGYRDTIYKDTNDLLVWETLPKDDPSCQVFEGITHTLRFVQGVGGPFYNIFNSVGPGYMEELLVYYKNVSGTWGSLVTAVKEAVLSTEDIDLFPNPTNGLVYISSKEDFVKYDIVDLSGVLLKTNAINNRSIDISGLKAGMYIVHLTTRDSRTVVRKIHKV